MPISLSSLSIWMANIHHKHVFQQIFYFRQADNNSFNFCYSFKEIINYSIQGILQLLSCSCRKKRSFVFFWKCWSLSSSKSFMFPWSSRRPYFEFNTNLNYCLLSSVSKHIYWLIHFLVGQQAKWAQQVHVRIKWTVIEFIVESFLLKLAAMESSREIYVMRRLTPVLHCLQAYNGANFQHKTSEDKLKTFYSPYS